MHRVPGASAVAVATNCQRPNAIVPKTPHLTALHRLKRRTKIVLASTSWIGIACAAGGITI